jgi:YaiO family outer membrane protein
MHTGLKVPLLLLLFHFSVFVSAQNKNDSLSSDELFRRAREQAFAGNYAAARALCAGILLKDTSYYDAAVLSGRTYAWEKKFDSARIHIEPVLKKNKKHYDALDALTDIGIWSGKYDLALETARKGLLYFSGDTSFLYRKALAEFHMGKYRETIATTGEILNKYPKSSRTVALHEMALEALRVNRIGLHYIHDFFNPRMASWNMGYLEYIRKTKSGNYIARMNYASRFGNSGYMLETDAWPKLGERNYAYVNAGISNGIAFPDYRLGAELYQKFNRAFEGSLGFRFLSYDTLNVMIYTASVSKYIGSSWISLRPYLTPENAGLSTAITATYRYYYKTADDYLTLMISSGSSPDNRNLQPDQSVLSLKMRSFYFDYQRRVSAHFIVKGLFGYSYEEYFQSKFRHRNTLGAAVYYVF